MHSGHLNTQLPATNLTTRVLCLARLVLELLSARGLPQLRDIVI